MKMKDAFVLPISDTRFCKFFSMEQCKKAEFAMIAINSHDKLVEMLDEVIADHHGLSAEMTDKVLVLLSEINGNLGK